MPYTKVHSEWEDLPSTDTPINAAALDQIEAGIADAQNDADSANTSIGNHIADSSGAHAASAISFSPTGTIAASTVQAAIAEVASDAAADVTAHTGDSSGAHAATAISFSPTGSVSSSNVQAAIAEVAASVAGGILPDGDYGDITVSSSGTAMSLDADAAYQPGGTDVPVTDGGTGASTAADARTNLGVDYDTIAADDALTGAFAPSVLDEDDMASDSATRPPSQQSTKAYVGAQVATKVAKSSVPEVIVVAVSDETTAITTGTAKVTFRMPFAMTLTAVRASLSTASSSGNPTFDINEGGSSILSTKLSIDASEKTSTTAASAAVISDSALADDAEITIDVDTAGTGAKGAKVYLIGTRSV